MIRLAQITDLPAIVAIYNEAVSTRVSTADLTPVTVESRFEWFGEHNPKKHPIYVWEAADGVVAWCSLSPYRKGRMALRFTAELSYYTQQHFHRQGIATRLVEHAIASCAELQLKNLFAIVLETNVISCQLLKKFGFQQWAFLPKVADFDGQECGHLYFGLRLLWPNQASETVDEEVTPRG